MRLRIAIPILLIVASFFSIEPALARQKSSMKFDTTLYRGLQWREIGPFRGGRSIAVAQTATGLALLLLLGPPGLPMALFSLILAGLFASSLTAWAQTIRMRLIPPALRGRVFALLRTLMNTTPPLGALVGGAMLAADNVTLVIVTMAFVVTIPGAIGLVHPALRPIPTTGPAISPPAPRG